MDVDCRNGNMTASWPLSWGALSYIATLRGPDGKMWASCTTNGSDCDIGPMPCGESLVLGVVAEGASCYSRRSQDFPISTGKADTSYCTFGGNDTRGAILVTTVWAKWENLYTLHKHLNMLMSTVSYGFQQHGVIPFNDLAKVTNKPVGLLLKEQFFGRFSVYHTKLG